MKAAGVRAGRLPTSPSSLATLGIRGILEAGFCAAVPETGVAVPLVGVSLSSDLGLFCGGPWPWVACSATPLLGEVDRCRFRDSGDGDMLLFFDCAGDDVLLCDPFEMTSSGTVFGISVNLSRAGS